MRKIIAQSSNIIAFTGSKNDPSPVYGAKIYPPPGLWSKISPYTIYGAIFFTPSAFAHSFDQKAKS
jgi:hypothetical protein